MGKGTKQNSPPRSIFLLQKACDPAAYQHSPIAMNKKSFIFVVALKRFPGKVFDHFFPEPSLTL